LPLPRGGAIVEITGAKIVINAVAAVNYMTQKGALLAAALSSGVIIGKKISVTAISIYVRDVLPSVILN
jgi:hypothetical protein